VPIQVIVHTDTFYTSNQYYEQLIKNEATLDVERLQSGQAQEP